MEVLKKYYYLTKPGIVRGNLMTAGAGFLLASKTNVDWLVFFMTLLGVALIIASGCVFNNYIDRKIDKKMERTKKRSIVTGEISVRSALIYGAALGLLGVLSLAVFTNLLTVLVGLIGWFFYVVVYAIGKRKTVHGTLIGTIPGATPPLAGYLAVGGDAYFGGILLFLALVFWQMPHFYAIAIFRKKDYKSAGLPVLPIVKGVEVTKKQIVAYIAAFMFAANLLYVFEYVGILYLIVIILVCLWWLYTALNGSKTKDDTKWAQAVFGVSLIVLLVFSLMVAISPYLEKINGNL